MGWGDCGVDSEGRHIGYVFPATCDYPGCAVKIDRGLSYACGSMHGESDQWGNDATCCEKYFCSEHRTSVEVPSQEDESKFVEVCLTCYEKAPRCACGERSWTLNSDGRCGDCATL